MTTSINANLSAKLAGAMATVAVAAMGFAGNVQARDNISWSIGVGTPGAVVNVGNGGGYYPQPAYVQQQPVYIQQPNYYQQQPTYIQQQPVYVQPRPVYVQPAPIYYQPRPVFVRPDPVYVAPQPIYYSRPHQGRHWRNGGEYMQNRNQYGSGNGQVYYQRDGRYGRDDY